VLLTVANFKCIPMHPLTRKPACGAEAAATLKPADFGMVMRGVIADDMIISVTVEGLQE